MKTMKRVIKCIIFIGCFYVCFITIQHILHYRWAGNEDLYTRLEDYSNQEHIDVVIIGTSEAYAGIDPIVLYNQEGITAYNLCVSYSSAITQYYQLMYALKVNKPSMVICDFSSLYYDNLPSEVESLYRKIVDCTPDKKIKNQLIKDICCVDASQNSIYWYFPLFRYHSMWNDIKDKNFEKDYVFNAEYKMYSKGALLKNKNYTPKENYAQLCNEDITPNLWEAEESTECFSELSLSYYDKMIDTCNAEGIRIVAYLPPKLSQAKLFVSRYNKMKEYFDSRNVKVYNYNSYEQVLRMNLILEDDYYDQAHLNVYGSIKMSKALAEDLTKDFIFEDRRLDTLISSEWDKEVAEFEKEYGSLEK